jgi:transposase
MKNSAVRIHLRLRADISIAEVFGVGTSFIKKTLKIRRDIESRGHRHRGGAVVPLNEEQLETLQAAVEICPDATLEELRRLVADECKVTVSRMSIRRTLKKLNLPLLKREGRSDYILRPEHKDASL